MEEMKEKFINLIKNEIFALDKELNFGIYKIFKKSENQIDKLLKNIASADENIREDIYNYLYNFFSLYYEGGDFGYTKRAFATFTVPYTHKEFQIESKEKCSIDSSHSFFYDGEETKFTWRTEESYYIKSNKYFSNVEIEIDDVNVIFKVDGVDKGFDSKKSRLFRLLKGEKNNDKIILHFNISNTQTPKHAIYLFVRYLVDNNKNELEYIPSKEFEEIPPKKSLFNDFKIEEYKKYLFEKDKSIFKNKESKEEEKFQIFSFKNSLYITKKEYASKVYSKTEAKNLLNKKKFDFENKEDIEVLFKKDELLNFFYKLDRGFNNFLVGIDSDYFIHKNLKRFLLVEFDKFIKNYVLGDTDLLLSDDEKAKKQREKARVFKEKAQKLIEFLAAVEEFQKYIWEKRKLIKEVNYIISSNKINDENILNEVLENENQKNEWKELGLCENTPSLEELKEKPYPIDTKYFDEEFKIKLLSQFENLEEKTDGILINSENFQALKFLEPKFKEQIKCIYIDPPYNTGNDGFVYKDNYQEASWLSMMNDRLSLAKELMKDDGVIFSSIDDREVCNLRFLKDNVFKIENFIAQIAYQRLDTVKNDAKYFSENHEYIVSYAKEIGKVKIKGRKRTEEHNKVYKNLDNDPRGPYLLTPLHAKSGSENSVYTYRFKNGIEWQPPKGTFPRFSKETLQQLEKENKIYFGSKVPQKKTFLSEISEYVKLTTFWDYKFAGSTRQSNKELREIMGRGVFNNPKPTKLLKILIDSVCEDLDIILDFFAGSGTTGDAVIRLNSESEEKRKFILVEINGYFNDVIIPRIKKVSFSTEWKSGEAKNSNGIGGIYQYFSLTSYEELIENLELKTKDVDIEAEFIFNPLKNKINSIEIKSNLEMLLSFVYHRGFKLEKIKKEKELLIGECKEGIIILGKKGYVEDLESYIDKTDKKIYTNFKLKNNVNHYQNRVEIITSADFKGI